MEGGGSIESEKKILVNLCNKGLANEKIQTGDNKIIKFYLQLATELLILLAANMNIFKKIIFYNFFFLF